MAQISAATGIQVKYVGPTTMIPAATPDAPLPQGVNLVIAWGNNTEVPEFGARSADGLGGPGKGFYAKDAQGRRVTMTTEAGVTLQTEAWNGSYDPTLESLTRPTVGHLLLHEIGHAFGLDHSVGADEMMFGGAWAAEPDGVGVRGSRPAS